MSTLEPETLEPGGEDRLGEALETFLALAEAGIAPSCEAFAAQYSDIRQDLLEALGGLSLVRGLVGGDSDGTQKLEAGRRLAGYRIVGELGSGGMGTVYEAVHVDLDRPVALKVLDARATQHGKSSLQRFINEAKTAASLHHTHIVPVFDVGHVGGLCYYAMQRIQGAGLDQVLRTLRRDRSLAAGSTSGRKLSRASSIPAVTSPENSKTSPKNEESQPKFSGQHLEAQAVSAERLGTLSGLPSSGLGRVCFQPPHGSSYFRWVAEVGRQAASALAHAHLNGVIHRDIKPSNILVDSKGSIWVADFGLARRLSDPGLTHGESLVGTPRYMSPEQARSGQIDPRTDTYSLGATLYELLALRPPFEGRSTAELVDQVTHREPTPPRRIDRRIPADLETVVLKAMAKRPADRYPSAEELQEDLERFLQFEPVRARRIGPVGRLWRLARRHPAVTAVSLISAALVLATATLAYVRVVHERDRAVAAESSLQVALRENLINQASLVRISPVPDRRDRGLNLLRTAAGMKPNEAQLRRLRSEAVSFLTLRDVVQSPSLKCGRTAGVAFSPDGANLATVSDDTSKLNVWSLEDSSVRLSEIPTGPQPAGQSPAPGGGPPSPFFFGQRVAIAGSLVAVLWPDNHGLRTVDLATGLNSEDLPMPQRDLVSVFGLTPSEGPRLITVERVQISQSPASDSVPVPPPFRWGPGDRDRPRYRVRVLLWDLDDLSKPLATLVEPAADDPEFSLPLVAISSDSEMIATTYFGTSAVRFWESAQGEASGELDARTAITSLALAPHGQVATAGGGAVRLWDIASQSPVAILSPNQGFVRHLSFSPDGSILAVGGPGTDIELWDPAGNELVAALTTADRVSSLGFTPAGNLLAVAQPDSVALWSLEDSTVQSRASGFQAPPSALAFGKNGWLAISLGTEQSAQLWHPDRSLATSLPVPGAPASAVAFDSDNRLVLLRPTALEWLIGSSREEPQRSLPLPEQPMRFGQLLARSADGKSLVVQRSGFFWLWRASQADKLSPIIVPRPRPSEPGFRPPEGGEAKSKEDRKGGPPRGRLNFWSALALSPSGDCLYLGSWSGEAAAVSLQGNQIASEKWPRLQVPDALTMSISPDGRTLAVGTRTGKVALIDASVGTLRNWLNPYESLQNPDAWITSLCFSPSNEYLAAGSRSGTVFLWRLDPSLTPAPPLPLTGHRGTVLSVAFDSSGSLLATGAEDRTIQIWRTDALERAFIGLGLSSRTAEVRERSNRFQD